MRQEHAMWDAQLTAVGEVHRERPEWRSLMNCPELFDGHRA
jgi:hypothetical protein